MERLLDPSLPDAEFVALLEQAVQVIYTSTSAQERNLAQTVLTELQSKPDAWIRCDKILESPSASPSSRFFGLQIMDNMIRYRWKTLPRQTSEQIRDFVVKKVIDLSSVEETMARERMYIGKLNLILVQIVKQEWPAHWRTFISEIVGASKTSVSLCENNMNILALLSEEVFEFSTGQMTQDKIIELKNQFNEEFGSVFQLCQYVFGQAAELKDTRPSLLVATLKTLERFLSWIPLGYIFETGLIESLVGFVLQPNLRLHALRCLVEIGSLSIGNLYDTRFTFLFLSFMTNLTSFLPPGTDIAASFTDADDDTQAFVMDLALFFTGFFKNHLVILEREEGDVKQALRIGCEYLVKISMVEEVEVFKACLEWWHHLSQDLYETESMMQVPNRTLMLGVPSTNQETVSPRRMFYAPTLSAVRRVMIHRMAKPEEVLIVEDENGEIVRETTKDTDAIALYKTMRETLVFLTHLDVEETENIMLDKLSRQIDGSEWSWNNLNTLCWAVGSISGAMGEEEEKKFLVTVIKDLLHLCEMKRGKDNKAVVASNIMYVVGQYPRFLRAHWKFLKTVVNKLFEFMHETHPGVQDMACDTFLTIAQKCKKKFVTLQPLEVKPFIVEMLDNLQDIIAELEPHQVQSFYESCGCIIASHTDPAARAELVGKLFVLPNKAWASVIARANAYQESLRERDTTKQLVNILKTNTKVASSMGSPYLVQLKVLHGDMLKLFHVYSDIISNEVAALGSIATKKVETRNMRAVKKEVLRVIEAYLSAAEESTREVTLSEVIQPLSEPILHNYYSSIPEARDAEVLSLFAQIITFMRGLPVPAVRTIFKSLFGVTLDMIRSNFEDFPDARLNFFKLLRAINQFDYLALFQLDENPSQAEEEFRLVINAIVWAFKHTEKNVAETGLQILLELLQNVDGSPYANYFYKMYFKLILNEILSVLVDTLHKPGFKRHAQILMHLLRAMTSGRITDPTWNEQDAEEVAMASAGGSVPSNTVFVRSHLLKLLRSAFPNMSEAQVVGVVKGMIEINDERTFKSHLRDFLVQTKEFGSGDNTDLFDEERQLQQLEQQKAEAERLARTPGLLPPARIDTGMNEL